MTTRRRVADETTWIVQRREAALDLVRSIDATKELARAGRQTLVDMYRVTDAHQRFIAFSGERPRPRKGRPRKATKAGRR